MRLSEVSRKMDSFRAPGEDSSATPPTLDDANIADMHSPSGHCLWLMTDGELVDAEDERGLEA